VRLGFVSVVRAIGVIAAKGVVHRLCDRSVYIIGVVTAPDTKTVYDVAVEWNERLNR
jgi:hypothetical protein